jgi:diacylglycerol kinase (ATP)
MSDILDRTARHHVAIRARDATPLLVVVNGHASGVPDPEQTTAELVALLEERGRKADGAVTPTELGLWEALHEAAATRRRVVLVGGDGSLHSAANAPLEHLPEIALVPAGRANNIARGLGIPTDRIGAVTAAAHAPASPLDTLLVRTPEQRLYAIEAVSAGFQAAARADYRGENSADMRAGALALARAVARYRPYRVRAAVDGAPLASDVGAQLFLSNLPYFGFGFEVDPRADPADGRFEAILIEARGRRELPSLLAAAYRGRHLRHPGVRLMSGRRAELLEPLPLVADAQPLGTTTATLTVDGARLRVARGAA